MQKQQHYYLFYFIFLFLFFILFYFNLFYFYLRHFISVYGYLYEFGEITCIFLHNFSYRNTQVILPAHRQKQNKKLKQQQQHLQ